MINFASKTNTSVLIKNKQIFSKMKTFFCNKLYGKFFFFFELSDDIILQDIYNSKLEYKSIKDSKKELKEDVSNFKSDFLKSFSNYKENNINCLA